MTASTPTILLLINDLIFETKIRSTAQSLGLGVETAGNATSFTQAAQSRPFTAFVVDLNAGPDVIKAIQTARSSATRPKLIAFGSHVQTDLLAAARDAGADDVMPRSRLSAELPALLSSIVDDLRREGL